MKTASVHELKKELSLLPAKELVSLCMDLAKYKKDNKEFLTYLLFNAHDEHTYLASVKEEMDLLFSDVNVTGVYFAKKTLRKIIRIVNKYIRYAGSKTVEIELLIHYCQSFKKLSLDIASSTVLTNLYAQQLKKIEKAISTLHEDLQYDYELEIKSLY